MFLNSKYRHLLPSLALNLVYQAVLHFTPRGTLITRTRNNIMKHSFQYVESTSANRTLMSRKHQDRPKNWGPYAMLLIGVTPIYQVYYVALLWSLSWSSCGPSLAMLAHVLASLVETTHKTQELLTAPFTLFLWSLCNCCREIILPPNKPVVFFRSTIDIWKSLRGLGEILRKCGLGSAAQN